MAEPMYEGRGSGGPMDGIKLTAPLSWDGLIPLPRLTEGSAVRYHPGKYIWQSRAGRWLWTETTPTAYCRYDEKQKRTVHRWYGSARPGEKCLCSKQVLIKIRVSR